MSQAIMHLSDVYLQKGYEGKPQTKFTANEGSEYGSLTFKVSHKKGGKKGEKGEYDNYSITWRNVKGDSKVIELLNQPSVKVSLYGEATQEEYEGKKFVRVTCDGRNAVTIAQFGEKSEGAPAASSGSASNDDL